MTRAWWLALLVFLAPGVATATTDPSPPSDEEVAAPSPEPADEPADEAAADDEVAYVPDPAAAYPAGLDPRTLCAADRGCAPAAASTSTTTSTSTPLASAGTVTAALLDYGGHPTRTGGTELGLRIDLWRGQAWAAQLGYTLDLIAPIRRGGRGGAPAPYHDLSLGGRYALPVARPAWLLASAHLLRGPSLGGDGAAGYGAVGVRLAGLDLQLGLGGLTLDGDGGATGSLRLARGFGAVTGWGQLDVGRAVRGGVGAVHVGGAAGVDLRYRALGVSLSALLGDRVFAVLDDGATVEAVDDTFHTTGRAAISYDLGVRVHPYLGASLRTATTADGIDYTLLAGFAGLTLSF